MSAVFVLTPALFAAWPAISAAVAGAAAALGLGVAAEAKQAAKSSVLSATSVEVALENSEVVSEALATQEQIVLTKGDIRLRVYRDERGQCRVCAEGEGHSEVELRQVAKQLADKITQVFVYNKVMTELKNKGFTILQDEVAEDETVRIRARLASE